MKKSILVLIIILIFGYSTIKAEDYILPSSFFIADEDGALVEQDGQYFMEAEGIRPGDHIVKKLNITNLSYKQGYDLYFYGAEIKTTGPVSIPENLNMEVKIDGVTLYNGIMSDLPDPSENEIPVLIGNFKNGVQKEVVFDLIFSSQQDLEDFQKLSTTEVIWVFEARINEETNPIVDKIPQTGFNNNIAILYLTLGSVLLIIRQKKLVNKQ